MHINPLTHTFIWQSFCFSRRASGCVLILTRIEQNMSHTTFITSSLEAQKSIRSLNPVTASLIQYELRTLAHCHGNQFVQLLYSFHFFNRKRSFCNWVNHTHLMITLADYILRKPKYAIQTINCYYLAFSNGITVCQVWFIMNVWYLMKLYRYWVWVLLSHYQHHYIKINHI